MSQLLVEVEAEKQEKIQEADRKMEEERVTRLKEAEEKLDEVLYGAQQERGLGQLLGNSWRNIWVEFCVWMVRGLDLLGLHTLVCVYITRVPYMTCT